MQVIVWQWIILFLWYGEGIIRKRSAPEYKVRKFIIPTDLVCV